MGAADDALGHEELCTVDDEPGEVTKEKHNDNADKVSNKVHLIVCTGVVAGGYLEHTQLGLVQNVTLQRKVWG